MVDHEAKTNVTQEMAGEMKEGHANPDDALRSGVTSGADRCVRKHHDKAAPGMAPLARKQTNDSARK